MEKLDLKDRKILYELDLDARQTDKEIARKVGLSREATRYRIQKLIDEGYINYFMTILNTMKLGFDWYRTFFKFQNVNLQKEKEIIDWLKEKASWITKVEGKWDLNTGIFCKNVYEFRDIINEFLVEFSEFIERYEVSIVTRMWHYHRDYLVEKKNKTSKAEIMGFSSRKDYKIEKIDEIEYKIIDWKIYLLDPFRNWANYQAWIKGKIPGMYHENHDNKHPFRSYDMTQIPSAKRFEKITIIGE